MRVFRAGVLSTVLLAACIGAENQAEHLATPSVFDDALLEEFSAPLAPATLLDNRWQMFSSADPEVWSLVPIFPQGNADFGNFLADCRKTSGPDPLTFVSLDAVECPAYIDGLVLAHATGAGAIGRIWMTALDILSGRQWEEERLQIYVDGRAAPAVDERLDRVALGLSSVFKGEWAGIRSGSLVSYTPIRFDSDAWVVLKNTRKKLYYYQVDMTVGELATASPLIPVEVDSAIEVTTVTTLYSASGAGAATTLTLRAPHHSANALRNGLLHFAFDGVESTAKVGDLCNAAFSWAAWQSSRVEVRREEDGYSCALHWGWPHAHSGMITLEVAAPDATYAVIERARSSARLPDGRFFAYTATHESATPLLHTWADVKGDGRLVALYLAAEGSDDTHNLVPDPLNFLEGDEAITIDGKVVARGTGTEDFFNGGFYFKDGPYGAPWGGVSRVGVLSNGWGRAQMARFFLGADQVRFRKSFYGTLEVGVNHPDIPHHYRSLAIFYVRAPAP